MNLDTLIQIGLPISLGLIMLSMGLTLNVSDFGQVKRNPKAFVVGLSAQLILVPLLALILLQIFKLPPLFAMGLLILSFSPGGTTSNLFSYLARGDVALSIALTTTASIITPFSIPLLTELALQSQLGESTQIQIPLALTMKRLIIVTLLPVILGMALRYLKPNWANTMQPFIHKISVSMFLFVIVLMTYQLLNKMPEHIALVATVCSIMIIVSLSLGHVLSKLISLNSKQSKTISIEVGMQNGGMALIVTQSILNNTQMSMVPVIYGLIMLIPVILFVMISRRETATAI